MAGDASQNCWRPLRAEELVPLAAFGRRLRQLRQESGLSQETLSWRALVSTRQIRYLETAESFGRLA